MVWYLDGLVVVNVNQEVRAEDNDLITFVLTIDDKTKACLGGYYFNFHCPVRSQPGTKRHQCEDQRTIGINCTAYIWERNGRATKRGNEHSHPPNAARLHHLQVGYITVFENNQKSRH